MEQHMKHRVTTRGRATKGSRRKAAKFVSAPTATRHRPSVDIGLQEQLDKSRRELREALDQQTAISEILASISGSMTDAQPVFEVIVRNLRRLFSTGLAMVLVLKDGIVHLEAAAHDVEFEILKKAYPQPLDDNSGGGRAMISKQVIQFAPISNDPAAPPLTKRMARELGFETAIFAPMMRGDTVVGAIATARPGSKPFDARQVALLKSFADQAVIAIENARLFTETKEALEQQTATGEVLKIVASSPG